MPNLHSALEKNSPSRSHADEISTPTLKFHFVQIFFFWVTAILLMSASAAWAAQVTLAWDVNSQIGRAHV
jgi:hypothetical protein